MELTAQRDKFGGSVLSLPKRPASKRKATEASRAAKAVFEEAGWIYRNQEDQEDYGIDAEVEVVSGDDVTGWIFKAQVRWRDIEWNGGIWGMQVDVSTLSLWRELPVPVLVLAYDGPTKALYWTTPSEATPRRGAETVSLRFDQRHILRGQLRDVAALLQAWRAGYGDRHLEEVPLFFQMFRELEESAQGDFFLDIGHEIHDRLRLFYRHMLRLRYALGLSMSGVPRVEFWRAVEDSLGDHGSTLRYGMLATLIDVIRPRYYEALLALVERIDGSESLDEDAWQVSQLFRWTQLNMEEAERQATLARERVVGAIEQARQKSERRV